MDKVLIRIHLLNTCIMSSFLLPRSSVSFTKKGQAMEWKNRRLLVYMAASVQQSHFQTDMC